MKLLLLTFVVGICSTTIRAGGDPVVCIDRGCVRGINYRGNLKEFEGFLGIPYAKPPVDELRLTVSWREVAQSDVIVWILKMEIYALRVKFKESFYRFYWMKDPEPVDVKFDGVYNATQEKNCCMQKNYLLPNPTVFGVEDCLYLYVYRPKVRSLMKHQLSMSIENQEKQSVALPGS